MALPTRRSIATASVIGLLVIAMAAALRPRPDAHSDEDDAIVSVARRTFSSTVTAVGAIKPQIGAEVRVGSRISGRVRRLRANIGDTVAKGQIIAELETEDLDALIAQRRAEQLSASARRAAVETLGPPSLARAASDVARFEATAKLTATELDRQQILLRQDLSARADAEAASERHAVAQAQLESARRAVDLMRAEQAEERAQADAEEARARAALQSALVDRSFAVLSAPISGVIASVATQEGETVAAGLNAPTFVTIIDLRRLHVATYVDEVDIGKIRVGQSATFTVDAFPSRDFQGRVSAIYPSATIQDNVVKYVVAIHIDGDAAGLRPEMTAAVRIQLETRTVLAVPARAIRRDGGATVVYVQVDGRATPRPVRVGWRDGPWAEIVDGLAEGDRVLINPPALPETTP
jgi:macrolide-specific efflux system membrane fusion protein